MDELFFFVSHSTTFAGLPGRFSFAPYHPEASVYVANEPVPVSNIAVRKNNTV